MWSFPGVTEPITYFEEVKRAQDEKERRQADAEEQGKGEGETARADDQGESVVGEDAPAVSASVASPSRKQEEEDAIEEEGGRGARPAKEKGKELEGNRDTNRRKRKKRKTEVATASPAPAKANYAPTYKQKASRSSEELEAIRYRPLRFHLRLPSHTRADVFTGKAGTRASCPRALPGLPPLRRTSCSLLVPRPSSGGDSYGRRTIEGRAPPPKQVRIGFTITLFCKVCVELTATLSAERQRRGPI